MILAAGRGERLRPLTESTPKPLVEVAGETLLGRHLANLSRAGYTDAVINVSHLAEQITARYAEGSAPGIRIAWSVETEPLETAGGIARARPLLGPAPFLLVNADIWCDFEFAGFRGIELANRMAHLLLVPNPRHHPEGDFSLQGDRVGNASSPRYTYAGIAVLSPRLLAAIGDGTKAPLGPLLRAAAGRGEVSGEIHCGRWNDVGSPERLAELKMLLEGPR